MKILTEPLTGFWAALVIITLMSWQVGSSMLGTPSGMSAGLVLAIAFLKVFIIMNRFMGVRTAPIWLRRTAIIWITACATGICLLTIM